MEMFNTGNLYQKLQAVVIEQIVKRQLRIHYWNREQLGNISKKQFILLKHMQKIHVVKMSRLRAFLISK